MSSTAARVRRRLARPTEAVERTRWLFFVIALVSLLRGGPVDPVGGAAAACPDVIESTYHSSG